ncbi:MAG TPA: zf-HC2 domain-containing protein [Polyangia bacterium]|nr:zf-HC2 domain-containing protein [Polyangia bacterium]
MTTRTDCHKLDETLMDFLYQELAADEMAEVRAHVDGCPRCTAEIERFQATRRTLGALEQLEPPAAVSAKLLHQAAAAHRRPLWRGRSRLFRYTAVAVPMLAAAAALVLVFHVKDKAMAPIQARPTSTVTAAPAAAPSVSSGPPAEAPMAGEAAPSVSASANKEDKSEGGFELADKPVSGKDKPAPRRKVAVGGGVEKKSGIIGRIEPDVKFKAPSTVPPAELGHAQIEQERKLASGSAGGKAAQPAPPPPAPRSVAADEEQGLKLQVRGAQAPQSAQPTPAPSKPKGGVAEYLEGRKNEPPSTTYRTPEINEMSKSMAQKHEIAPISPDDVFRDVLTSARENNCPRVVERVNLLENLRYASRNPQNMSEAYRHRADCQRNPSDKDNDLRRAQQLRYQIEQRASEQQRARQKPSKAADAPAAAEPAPAQAAPPAKK